MVPFSLESFSLGHITQCALHRLVVSIRISLLVNCMVLRGNMGEKGLAKPGFDLKDRHRQPMAHFFIIGAVPGSVKPVRVTKKTVKRASCSKIHILPFWRLLLSRIAKKKAPGMNPGALSG